jgi:hypothetical protein
MNTQQEIELENTKRDLAAVRDALKDFLYIMAPFENPNFTTPFVWARKALADTAPRF